MGKAHRQLHELYIRSQVDIDPNDILHSKIPEHYGYIVTVLPGGCVILRNT